MGAAQSKAAAIASDRNFELMLNAVAQQLHGVLVSGYAVTCEDLLAAMMFDELMTAGSDGDDIRGRIVGLLELNPGDVLLAPTFPVLLRMVATSDHEICSVDRVLAQATEGCFLQALRVLFAADNQRLLNPAQINAVMQRDARSIPCIMEFFNAEPRLPLSRNTITRVLRKVIVPLGTPADVGSVCAFMAGLVPPVKPSNDIIMRATARDVTDSYKKLDVLLAWKTASMDAAAVNNGSIDTLVLNFLFPTAASSGESVYTTAHIMDIFHDARTAGPQIAYTGEAPSDDMPVAELAPASEVVPKPKLVNVVISLMRLLGNSTVRSATDLRVIYANAIMRFITRPVDELEHVDFVFFEAVMSGLLSGTDLDSWCALISEVLCGVVSTPTLLNAGVFEYERVSKLIPVLQRVSDEGLRLPGFMQECVRTEQYEVLFAFLWTSRTLAFVNTASVALVQDVVRGFEGEREIMDSRYLMLRWMHSARLLHDLAPAEGILTTLVLEPVIVKNILRTYNEPYVFTAYLSWIHANPTADFLPEVFAEFVSEDTSGDGAMLLRTVLERNIFPLSFRSLNGPKGFVRTMLMWLKTKLHTAKMVELIAGMVLNAVEGSEKTQAYLNYVQEIVSLMDSNSWVKGGMPRDFCLVFVEEAIHTAERLGGVENTAYAQKLTDLIVTMSPVHAFAEASRVQQHKTWLTSVWEIFAGYSNEWGGFADLRR